MTSVFYNIFKEFIKKNNLTKQFWSNKNYGIDYIDSQGVVKASYESSNEFFPQDYFYIESEEAENLNTLELVNNIIKNKQK